MEGWIKLHRKIKEWQWKHKPEMVAIWLDILVNTQHKEKKIGELKLLPGQLSVGRKQLSERCGLSEQVVRSCLSRLKSTNEITIKSTNRYSVITVNNWESWQGSDDKSTSTSTSTSTNNQPATNQQPTTTKECKNEKNEKNIDILPYGNMIDTWNEIVQKEINPNTSGVKLTETRRSRLKRIYEKNLGRNISEWESYCKRISGSDFLSGRSGRWKVTIDWALKPENVVKVLEGNYDDEVSDDDFEDMPADNAGKNYGEISNGIVCSCGKHHGVRQWNPHQRAEAYAWFRDRQKPLESEQQEYLESYEKNHGKLESTLQ